MINLNNNSLDSNRLIVSPEVISKNNSQISQILKKNLPKVAIVLCGIFGSLGVFYSIYNRTKNDVSADTLSQIPTSKEVINFPIVNLTPTEFKQEDSIENILLSEKNTTYSEMAMGNKNTTTVFEKKPFLTSQIPHKEGRWFLTSWGRESKLLNFPRDIMENKVSFLGYASLVFWVSRKILQL